MNPFIQAGKRAIKQPAFLAAVILLGVAAFGLNALTSAMQLYFKKQPVSLTKPLATLPPRIGHWLQVSKDQKLAHDMEETLGATEYVFRDYINLDALDNLNVDLTLTAHDADGHDKPGESVKLKVADFTKKSLKDRESIINKLFENRSFEERRQILTHIQNLKPTAVLNCAVTYYTGMVDTVAHIPDRCYLADGFEVDKYDEPIWDFGGGMKQMVHFINFEDQSGARGQLTTRSVAYIFQVNGHYECNPLAVRARLQKLTEKYGYYAKIELMTLVKDRDVSAGMMQDFLASARPEVEKCLPDWDKVNGLASAQGGNNAAAPGAGPTQKETHGS